jgi:hypothetical protein
MMTRNHGAHVYMLLKLPLGIDWPRALLLLFAVF